MRRNKFFRDRAPTASTKAETVPKPVLSPQKDTPDVKKTGTKGARAVNQPKEEQKSSKPMETRGQASRAGGLRSGGGSGQKDMRVAKGNPSKT
jgi:hypothetical protein